MTFYELFADHHIVAQFPPKVMFTAQNLPSEVDKADLDGRRDLTDMQIITIDGDDAKDFDDAVSIDKPKNGNFRLGVHIADVSHYVTEKSPIDKSAFERGTSIYLIDTVIPMLPFELSNELCSLKPDVIRLTFSVFMEIDKNGKIVNYEIFKSFIKSRNRMTYKKVTAILDDDKELRTEFSHLIEDLENMQRLSDILHKKRIRRGALDFITSESLITLNDGGHPINVEPYKITRSNKIIEEFMLACNETVAKHMSDNNAPCVYRVHEKPDLLRVEKLGIALPLLGYNLNFHPDMSPKDFQHILDDVKDSEYESVVNYMVLRTMSKAKYFEQNLGHFGLAAEYYCHFTSPIRRYPDLIVHRILGELISGKLTEKRKDALKIATMSASITSSAAEINASDAEFKWKQVKKVEYMGDHIGENFTGIISHLTQSGFFVELENTVEGFVPARTLADDIYVLADNELSLCGMRNRKKYMVGDSVKIKVTATSDEHSSIDFELEEVVTTRRKKADASKAKRLKLSKTERRKLNDLKLERIDKKHDRLVDNEKQSFELNVFKKAITRTIADRLFEMKPLKSAEESYINVTLKDFSVSISEPVTTLIRRSENQPNVKNFCTAAAFRIELLLDTFSENFGIDINESFRKGSAKFVRRALLKYADNLVKKETRKSNREKQYRKLAEECYE